MGESHAGTACIIYQMGGALVIHMRFSFREIVEGETAGALRQSGDSVPLPPG